MLYDAVQWSQSIANHVAITMDERDLSLTEPETIVTTEVDDRPEFRSTSEDGVTIVDVMRPCVANAYDLGWMHGESLEKFEYPFKSDRRYFSDYVQGYEDGLKERKRKDIWRGLASL